MAEKLCTLRTKGGGGGKQTETVLWTNSSPASSFNAQNVTISDSVDNYDYIAITYRASASVADMATVVASVSDLKKSVGHNSTNHIAIHTGAQFSSGTIHARMVTYVNSTTIGFSLAYQLNSASSNAGWCIPTQIVGIKNMGGRGSHSVQTFTQAITAGATTWTTLSTPITVNGVATCVIVDNYNGMKWENTTKGTSGAFTDYYSGQTYKSGYASFDVSAGDTVKICANSGAERHIVVQIVGHR